MKRVRVHKQTDIYSPAAKLDFSLSFRAVFRSSVLDYGNKKTKAITEGKKVRMWANADLFKIIF